jgi:hypothetical protein
LGNTKISDAGLARLAPLKRLFVLDVDETPATYAGLAKLEKLIPGANFQEQLAISRIRIPELTIHLNSKVPRRDALEHASPTWPPAAGTLHFTRPIALTSSQIEDLRRLTSARALITHQTSFPAGGLEFLQDLRNLEDVIFIDGKDNLTDSDMLWLTKLPKLKWLHISASNLTDEALRHIAAIPHLESLDVDSNKFTNDGVAYLRSVLSLRSLTLNSTQLTPELLINLRRLPQLQSLKLYLWYRGSGGNPYGPPPDKVVAEAREAMKTLVEFPALIELGTRGNMMGPEVLSPVTKLVNLQRFQVDSHFVSHEAARQMQEAMPHCHVQRMSGK